VAQRAGDVEPVPLRLGRLGVGGGVPATTLSSQLIESAEEMRMPSRPAMTSALLVMVLPRIWLRSLLPTVTPSCPASSITLLLIRLSLDFLLGWSATDDDFTTWMPCKPVLVIVHPWMVLSLEASSSMPSQGTVDDALSRGG
jgi:hypothetical protein